MLSTEFTNFAHMKQIKFTLTIVVLLCLAFACDNSRRVEYINKKAELTHIYKNYRDHKPLAEPEKLDSLLEYFEKNGSAEDVFLCSYCKGAALCENRLYKTAYQELYKSYELAPKSLVGETRDAMCGLLSHMQQLCAYDYNLKEALMWWKKADSLKIFEPDVLYRLYYDRAMLFLYNQKQDSCNVYINKSVENMLRYPMWDDNKRGCLSSIVSYHAVTGNNAEFKKVYRILLQHPYDVDDTNLDYVRGLFYSQLGKKDSARIFFRRALKDPDHALSAATQLGIDARNHKMHDTVFYYFQKCVTIYDSIVAAQGKSYTRDLEAFYKAQEKEQKIAEQRITILSITLGLCVALLLALAGAWLSFAYRKHLKRTRRELDDEKKRREELEIRLQEALDSVHNPLLDKEREDMKQELDKILHELACLADAQKAASTEMMAELIRLFVTLYPEACEGMKACYPRIKSSDYVICALAMFDFKQSQIAKLMDRENSEVYNFMRRISKGLTGEAIGRMSDFKVMLEERFFGVE